MIKFMVRGKVRFLSHAETVKVFQRACVRAGMNLQHSRGYNPHAKLSLPLPRSVGVESDDELLCVQVARDPNELPELDYVSQIKTGLYSQLPEGLDILTVSVKQTKSSFQPSLATYILLVRREYAADELRTRIERLLASDNLNVQRWTEPKSPKLKNVDVRCFLKSIELSEPGAAPDVSDSPVSIKVECKISSAGSIRVDEVFELLELGVEDLAAPIRRANVQWDSN